MPYIDEKGREQFEQEIFNLGAKISNVGELNYVITRVALQYLKKIGMNYSNFSNVTGTLNLVPLEIWRRLGTQYEHMKMNLNGDLPEFRDQWWIKEIK